MTWQMKYHVILVVSWSRKHKRPHHLSIFFLVFKKWNLYDTEFFFVLEIIHTSQTWLHILGNGIYFVQWLIVSVIEVVTSCILWLHFSDPFVSGFLHKHDFIFIFVHVYVLWHSCCLVVVVIFKNERWVIFKLYQVLLFFVFVYLFFLC